MAGDTLIGWGGTVDVSSDDATYYSVANAKNVSMKFDNALAEATTLDSNGYTQKKYGNMTGTADFVALYDSAEHATTAGQGMIFDDFFTSKAGLYVRLRPSTDAVTPDKLYKFPCLVASLAIDISDSGEVIEFSCTLESNGTITYTNQT